MAKAEEIILKRIKGTIDQNLRAKGIDVNRAYFAFKAQDLLAYADTKFAVGQKNYVLPTDFLVLEMTNYILFQDKKQITDCKDNIFPVGYKIDIKPTLRAICKIQNDEMKAYMKKRRLHMRAKDNYKTVIFSEIPFETKTDLENAQQNLDDLYQNMIDEENQNNRATTTDFILQK